MTTTRLYTAEDLCRMPGDEPWELWDGELRRVPGCGDVEASSIDGNIYLEVKLFVRERDLGVVTVADGSCVLSRHPDTVIVPDVAFVLRDRLPERQRTKRYCPVPPHLAIYVQSPSDEPKEMAEKRALYERAGVPLLWWINPDHRAVSVHHPDEEPVEMTEADTLGGGYVLPGLRIPVSDIFA